MSFIIYVVFWSGAVRLLIILSRDHRIHIAERIWCRDCVGFRIGDAFQTEFTFTVRHTIAVLKFSGMGSKRAFVVLIALKNLIKHEITEDIIN